MSSDCDVLIVGGGPAGVAAALALRKAGVARVNLVERDDSLGGATRHCSHSPFGMLEYGRVFVGGAYGRRLQRDAEAAGVSVLTRHSVTELRPDGSVEICHPAGLSIFFARRILLATGAREKPRSARMLRGDRPLGVITTGTLQAYVAFHGLMPFRRPVIVGSELVSYSAALTCLMHGARPVAMVDSHDDPLARAPVRWFPRLAGVPVRMGARIVGIHGEGRVDRVLVARGETVEAFDCDGLLLTGDFVPEAALLWQAGQQINAGSWGPEVDQNGRCANPTYFAAGNLLRPIETAGWCFREGRAIGQEIARDLMRADVPGAVIPVTSHEAIKLVVPNLLRAGCTPSPGFDRFQLRFRRFCRGEVMLKTDGHTIWRKSGVWRPERRFLVPMPAGIENKQSIHFELDES